MDASSKGFFGVCALDAERIVVAARERFRLNPGGKGATDCILHTYNLMTGKPEAAVAVRNLYDVHQIAISDDKVFLTDTEKNRVVSASLSDGDVVEVLNIGTLRTDVNHVNAVAVHDKSLYIGLNNRGDKDAEILKIALADIQGNMDLLAAGAKVETIQIEGLRHTHDLRFADGYLYFCASHAGDVYRLGEATPFFSAQDWVRGLAVTSDSVWVGVSQKAVREERHREDLVGYLLQVDKATGELKQRIELPGAGQVNDIVAMPSTSIADQV